MSIKLTNHAQKRSQQRNIKIDFVCEVGEFINQKGGEGISFMSDKVVNLEIEKLRKQIKRIQDGREEGDMEGIRLIKKEIKMWEKMRGRYVAFTSCGVAKTCCYATNSYQKRLLRERKGHRGRKGKKRHRTREMYRD